MAGKTDSQGKQNSTKKESSTAKADNGNTKADPSQELDSLLQLLQGDLSSIDANAALESIDQWHGILQKTKDPDVKELTTSLKELKQLLKGGKASGHDLGEAMIQVGDQTIELSSDNKELKTSLQKLGKQLTKAGNTLCKAEDQEHIEQINTLVDTLDEDLESIEVESAIAAIDDWYKILHKSEDKGASEIADNLKQLKQALKSSKSKGADIAKLLTQLGEQTTEAASEAPRGIKGPVQRLGKRLAKVGKAIES
ncbi:AAA family ATPase [Aliterella atlantica]|uniref:hypothetical protein n=1 Tax=Aliterella atlantica TaxID=1827278 RepID=UPI000695F1B8|nr:hypothetical protein [Aliterella atlantica]